MCYLSFKKQCPVNKNRIHGTCRRTIAKQRSNRRRCATKLPLTERTPHVECDAVRTTDGHGGGSYVRVLSRGGVEAPTETFGCCQEPALFTFVTYSENVRYPGDDEDVSRPRSSHRITLDVLLKYLYSVLSSRAIETRRRSGAGDRSSSEPVSIEIERHDGGPPAARRCRRRVHGTRASSLNRISASFSCVQTDFVHCKLSYSSETAVQYGTKNSDNLFCERLTDAYRNSNLFVSNLSRNSHGDDGDRDNKFDSCTGGTLKTVERVDSERSSRCRAAAIESKRQFVDAGGRNRSSDYGRSVSELEMETKTNCPGEDQARRRRRKSGHEVSRTASRSMLTKFLKLILATCFINLFLPVTVDAADELNLEQSIAAVFNKVAYGSSTTKRSIPENWSIPQISTLATPLLTTYRYRDTNDEWLRPDDTEPSNRDDAVEPEDRIDETAPSSGGNSGDPSGFEHRGGIDDTDMVKERRHQHKNHHHGPISYELDLEKDHALPTSAPNADILKGNTNKHYSNPNRYSNDRSRHNLQVYGRDNPQQPELGRDIPGSIRTYPETRRPSSLLETDAAKIASTQSSYNLLRNINPTPPMHRGELPSYSPPSRSFFTPPLPPEYLNPFADKPTLKGTNSGNTNYQNRRPLPPPSIMPKHDRIPFRPDLPQSPSGGSSSSSSNPPSKTGGPNDSIVVPAGDGDRKIFTGSGNADGKKKVLNTPSQNVNVDRFGDFAPHAPVNESQFEYEPMLVIPSISRILSGSNGRKDAIPDVLLRTVTAKPNFQPPALATHRPSSSQAAAAPQEPPLNGPRENSSPRSKFVEDDAGTDDDGDEARSHVDENDRTVVGPSTVQPGDGVALDETTLNIEQDAHNLPNVNRDKNSYQVDSKNTFQNSSSADSFHNTWNVSWNLHVYLTAILYTLLAVYSIYKIIRFDKLTHLFGQGYFIVVHLLLTTICVSRIFYLIYDPYNINMSFHKFISDIFLNLPLSLLAIAFATLICYLLKRTLNKTHFKVRPIFVIVFSFVHIFLCVSLHLLENFDLLGRNNHVLSLVCQFIYVLLCLFLGFSYLYLYKIIKKVLAKKSQNFSELSIQNLSYATHITIAIALLFVLMSVLQIYGIFGIKSHENFSNAPPYKWLAWGFQFSIRLIEISVIALLSWVVSLKLSVREKNIENNLSGFALFPCANSNSTVDNEIYPAICQTNQNVHNFTLRGGKTLYEDNYPLDSMDGIPNEIIGRPNLGAPTNSDRSNFERSGSSFERASNSTFQRPSIGHGHQHSHPTSNGFDHPMNNFDRGSVNNFERGSNCGTGRMTPVQQQQQQQFERNNFEQGSGVRTFERRNSIGLSPQAGHFSNGSRAESNQGLNCFDNGAEKRKNSEDHYENPDFDMEHTFRRSKRHDKYAESLDNCPVNSSRSNSVLGGAAVQKMPPFGSNIDHDQDLYNEPVDQAEYNFQNYERPNFERPSSRTNSNYGSKHMNRSDKRSNSSSSGNSGTFERRSMRKSGTLNDFGDRVKHGGGGGGGGTSHGSYRNGVQTLNSVQKVHSYGKGGAQKAAMNDELSDSMLVDENGFVRFRNLGTDGKQLESSRRSNSKSREHKNKNIYNT